MTTKKRIVKKMNLKALHEPFAQDKVKWRVGSFKKGDKNRAMMLAYIDARDVMDRLDSVVGAHLYKVSYSHVLVGGCVCEISIKIGDDWVSKANGADPSNTEGFKGMMSDAFKRAAVLWGIGRYLYDFETPWVDVDDWGNPTRDAQNMLNSIVRGSSNIPDSEISDEVKAIRLIQTADNLTRLSDIWLTELNKDQRLIESVKIAKDRKKGELS